LVKRAAFVVLLVFALAVAISNPGTVLAQPKTWIVDDDDPADFQRIQDALNAASSGDTVAVKAGTYRETLLVNKAVSIIGENKETTVVDGGGVGSVVEIRTSNVVLTNFTVSNAGRTWGPPPGLGAPDSCILVDSVSDVLIANSILTDAAVIVWIAQSSFVNVSDNVVLSGVYGGIIGYASSGLSLTRNLVDNGGLMGMHLDGYSNDNTIAENTVMNNVEGLELESGSARNWIEDNIFTNNNVSVVLNKCGRFNVFRRNTLLNSLYNLVVVGYTLESFLQDIDSSNLVDGKPVYYLTNLHGQVVSPTSYPDAGYLAIVNGTDVTVRDFSFVSNGDGVLLAYARDCTLVNMTVRGNRGPLLWGGLTFYSSGYNRLIYSYVGNNSLALSFYRSDWNELYENYFVDNERQVLFDFLSPFSNESSGYFSRNTWDKGFRGNYWSDYIGTDENKDDIGDTLYVVGVNNVDHYPLMVQWPVIDIAPPDIFIISPSELQYPSYTIDSTSITVIWEGWDDVSGIIRYEVRLDGGEWTQADANTSITFAGLRDGLHTIDIRAFDAAGNIRQESFEFRVNTVTSLFLSYVLQVVIVVVVIAVVIAALYFIGKRYLPRPRLRKTERRLVR